MALPASLRASVEAVLDAAIVRHHPVSGGCIHHGTRVETDTGAAYFLKWNAAADPEVFAAEEDGLRALRAAVAAPDLLVVPEPIARGGGEDAPPWLLMEWVAPGTPGRGYAERLGRGLAELHHRAGAPDYGWHRNNWIGTLEQNNTPDRSWVRFWTHRRIEPQLQRARAHGFLRGPTLDRYMEALPAALAEAGGPALVHGDLWSGNVFPSEEGKPALVDPAVYRGDGLVDLAMSELFGGFSPDFYRAYRRHGSVPAAYDACLRDAYQVYFLLVHVNLFGAGYESATEAAAARVVAAVR